MITDYFNYALQSLSQRRLRAWLTMLGIFIGVASVIALIGLGEGLRIAITSQFGFLGSDVLSVQASGIGFAGPPGTGVTEPLSDTLKDKVRNINGVETAFNRNIESAKVKHNDRQLIAFTASVPLGEEKKDFEMMVNLQAEHGRLLKDSDRRGVLVGSDQAKGESFGQEIKVGDRIKIQEAELQVIGILKRKGSFIFDNGYYMNDDTMADIFGDKDKADIIAIKVKNVNEIASVREDLEKLLRKERGVKEGEENFQIQSPQQTLEALNSALFAVNLFVIIIASISLLVGGIGIMNTMYTAVLERTKEIGIMKAIGARNSSIFTLFFFESGFLGLVGGIIGAILGICLSYGFAFLGRNFLGSELIQANVSVGLVISTLIFSFMLGTIFGVLPAVNASKLQPVVALRSK